MNVLEWSNLQAYTFFFVLVRVTSLIFFLPIFGDKSISPTIKILFGVALSFVCFPFVWKETAPIDEKILDSVTLTVISTLVNALLGIMIGFVSRWVFDAVQTAGHFISNSLGFSMASVLDPHTETQTTALSEMQYIFSALLFLALNGHHYFLVALFESFKEIPLNSVHLFTGSEALAKYLIQMSADVLILAVKLSAPILIVILLINMAFGLMARAVPHLNAFVVSFAANLIVGIFIVIISQPGFLNMVDGTFENYGPDLLRFIKLLGGK